MSMELKTNTSNEAPKLPPTAFAEALSKLVSVPRAEMQRRLNSAPKEPVSKHRRYKYVPEVPSEKP